MYVASPTDRQWTTSNGVRRRVETQPDRRRPAVFLDKDGTLIRNVPYNVDPDYVRLLPGVPAGLQRLHAAGYKLIVTTNQSGVARGYFAEEDLRAVESRLRELFAAHDVPLADVYYCPHHPDGVVPDYAITCACRKPEPGLLLRAAREHDIDCTQSWIVGDILNDVEAGRRAGCRTVLVDTGGETQWELSPDRLPHHVVSTLDEAARVITAVQHARESQSRA